MTIKNLGAELGNLHNEKFLREWDTVKKKKKDMDSIGEFDGRSTQLKSS